MKIEYDTIPRMTIEEFADANGLVMEVHERRGWTGVGRYYAKFTQVEVMEGGCLAGTFGDGLTPEEAIRAYAREISEKRIAYRAYHDDRKNIDVPVLTDK